MPGWAKVALIATAALAVITRVPQLRELVMNENGDPWMDDDPNGAWDLW